MACSFSRRLPAVSLVLAIATCLPGPIAQAQAQAQAQTAKAPFTSADMRKLETLSEPVFSSDGSEVYYTLTSNREAKAQYSDLWATRWSDGQARNLTDTPLTSEWQPTPLPCSKAIAMLADGGRKGTQLWIFDLASQQRRQITFLDGGVDDYVISPDGRSAVVVSVVADHPKKVDGVAPPIVIERFQTREDGQGWKDNSRSQLFRVDIATGTVIALTDAAYDNWMPSWSPDGGRIALVSKRCGEPDRHYCSDIYVIDAQSGETAENPALRISPFEGGDGEPGFEAGRPQWSPDGKKLVWVRAGEESTTWYTPVQLAVADLATGSISHPAWIDRYFYGARWSPDGAAILALVEQDRDSLLARVDATSGTLSYLSKAPDFANAFAIGPAGKVVLLAGGCDAPAALRTLEPSPRLLTHHNSWLKGRALATTRDIAWQSGDVEIHGQLLLPPGEDGTRPLPTVVRLHGGPVYQFSHEFMADWQILASHGYAVFAPNPRGSSGRGTPFAMAQMADWGNEDVADVRSGIDMLVAKGIADPQRIGVGGWSYGGILTDYLIASDPRIAAAVSGAGMGNFLGSFGVDQYARDYLLELGAPWEKPELWQRLSYPFFKAPQIKTPTLFLCADEDDNVPCSGGQQMYTALKTLGIPTRLVIYPGENHGLSTPAYLEDRERRSLEWYDRYLRPDISH